MPIIKQITINENTYEFKDAVARYDIGQLNNRCNSLSIDIGNLNINKENVSNKTNVLDQDSTQAQYPNAECVYNAIQNSKQFVEVTYGSTTVAEIDAILAAGKIPYIYYTNAVMIYQVGNAYHHAFASIYETTGLTIYGATITKATGVWSFSYFSASTSISATSTNQQLATAKAVYDYASPALYRHAVTIDLGTRGILNCPMMSSSSTPYTSSDFGTTLVTLYGAGFSVYATGYIYDNNNESVRAYALSYDDSIQKYEATGFNEDASPGYVESTQFTTSEIQDFNDSVTRI